MKKTTLIVYSMCIWGFLAAQGRSISIRHTGIQVTPATTDFPPRLSAISALVAWRDWAIVVPEQVLLGQGVWGNYCLSSGGCTDLPFENWVLEEEWLDVDDINFLLTYLEAGPIYIASSDSGEDARLITGAMGQTEGQSLQFQVFYTDGSEHAQTLDQLITGLGELSGQNIESAVIAHTSEGQLPIGIDESIVSQAKSDFRIPSNGWLDIRPRDGGNRRMTLNVRSFRRILNRFETEPEVLEHIYRTVDWFVNDTGKAHLEASEIDLPLVLAVAVRESGRYDFLNDNNEMVVTGGRSDTHTRGVGGLDNIGNRLDEFPNVPDRHLIQAVSGNTSVPGHLINASRNPAYLPRKYLLAAYVIETRSYLKNADRLIKRGLMTAPINLTESQADQLLANRTVHGRRGWMQARFGSAFNELWRNQAQLIRQKLDGGSFEDLLHDDEYNLNAIINNSSVTAVQKEVHCSACNCCPNCTAQHCNCSNCRNPPLRSDLSGHRVLLSVAESWILEQALPLALLRYRN